MKQRTLSRPVTIKGNSLHTGDAVTLTLKPAPVNHGVVFRRLDLGGSPEIQPRVDHVTDLVRATTIQSGHVKIHTVEHVLSALSGCGVDNVLVEMNASEPPIMDGSARPYANLILEASRSSRTRSASTTSSIPLSRCRRAAPRSSRYRTTA